jgi:8-oxo-dGTP pyrophosphatase MutT (NUDIX family)
LPALETLQRRLFWVVARTCFALYKWFPLFGSLRASIAIIRRDGKILAIERADGRGFSLPGGISSWRESEERTLRREVLEETGLTVTSQESKLRYHSRQDMPCTISVFEVQATGELKNSWEGTSRWMTLDELETRIIKSQRPVMELLKKTLAADSTR